MSKRITTTWYRLGIIGMVAYSIAGPPDIPGEVVSRPTTDG
jgi:hypothetical protein